MSSYKNIYRFILLVIIASSCSEKEVPVYNVPKDYRLWKKAVKEVLDYPVPGHGSTFRVIYANEFTYKGMINRASNGNERFFFPDGSVIIKEVYDNKKDINWIDPMLTIMIKDKENKDALDGWLYFVRELGEKQTRLVRGRMCIGCHEAANDKHPYFDGNPKGVFRDYVFVKIKEK